jgi:hypothetical protein
LISNPLWGKLHIRAAQKRSVKLLLYHKGKFNLKMFLHPEQSKRQLATLDIYLLQTTLPVIAALNQSQ